jgi:serine/threonine protein kinase
MAKDTGKSGGRSRRRDPTASGPEIPGYRITKYLGSGGFGDVYLAIQGTLGRLVAIKFLGPEGEAHPARVYARFRLAAEAMATVHHPHLLSIYDFGESEGRPYLVMEYAEGGDLRGRMDPDRPMPTDRARAIIAAVGEALACLHRHAMIHGNLKPENILLDEDDGPRVADFGIAFLVDSIDSRTRTDWGTGTIGYMAPEQQYRLNVDERADQYSLAAVAYELLTGHLPLGIFRPPSRYNPQLNPQVDAVIMRALQESPRERYPTIGDFTAELDRALSEGPWRKVIETFRPTPPAELPSDPPTPPAELPSDPPITLYFDTAEYSDEEIASILHGLSDLYRDLGGDALVIDRMEFLDPALVLSPEEV